MTTIHAGDSIRVKATGEHLTVKANLGPKFHPPLTVKENGNLYSLSEVELANEPQPATAEGEGVGGECPDCGADIAPADIDKPCWDCDAQPPTPHTAT